MTATSTELHPYDVRDPASLIRDISERVPLVVGTVHLALVRDVSTEQEVLRVDTLRLPAEILSWEEAREELSRVVEEWPVPDGGPARHTPVLVVVRPGLCVFGPNEAVWFLAERYANFLARVWTPRHARDRARLARLHDQRGRHQSRRVAEVRHNRSRSRALMRDVRRR